MKRLATAMTLTVVLAATLLGVTGTRQAMAAPLASQGCILGVFCFPWPPSSPSPSPSPSPTPTTTSPTPAASVGGTASGASSGLASPSGAASSPGTPSSSSAASPSASTSASAASLAASPSAASPTVRNVAAVPGLTAAAATSVLTAGTAMISGFHYVGNVVMPIAGGTETLMKFTASSIDLTGGVTVTVTQNGTTVTTQSDSQDFTSGVTLYAMKLSGTLQVASGLPGVPLSFTPTTIGISVLKLPNVGELKLANLITGAIPLTLTGVTTVQWLISSGSQVTTRLSMS